MQKISRQTSLYDQKPELLKKRFRSLQVNYFISITYKYIVIKIGLYRTNLCVRSIDFDSGPS